MSSFSPKATAIDQQTSRALPAKRADLFLFLEVFEREGGIQSYVQELLRSYLTLSDRPPAHVFLLRDGKACDNPFPSERLKFHYYRHKMPRLGRVQLAIALCYHLLRHRPQRVFCGHIHLAPLVWLLCQPLGIPYVVMTHGKEVWSPLAWLNRLALQQADQIWTVSRYSRDRSALSNQLDLGRMRLLPCPIDGDRFRPAAKSTALLNQYGLTQAKVLLTVARLWSGDVYKGVDVTLRALPAIAKAIPTVRYLVIGRGDDQPRLAKLAADLGVGDRVVFAGYVPTEALPEHYSLADAYVMPSQEGFGIVYLEAMAAGVPVLSGDGDGSADPLQDGRLGWRVPHRDPEAVARACIEILTADPQQERRVNGVWLREQAIAAFGIEAFRQQLHQLVDQLVDPTV